MVSKKNNGINNGSKGRWNSYEKTGEKGGGSLYGDGLYPSGICFVGQGMAEKMVHQLYLFLSGNE